MSVAKSNPHDSGILHVTGAARYTDDTALPGNALHLAFGLSEIARGRITKMDLAAVHTAPGVVAVLTAEDIPGENDVSPSIHDEPLLSDGTVHYLGQPLFLVVADSHLAARKAARLGTIDYAEETPILSIDEALAAGSEFEAPLVFERGDPGPEIARAPHQLSGQMEIGGQEHFYLEGQVAWANPSEDGGVLVQSSSQHPSEIQHKVAHALGLPFSAVRVEVRRMGGGFGGKESQGNALAVACAVAAHATGRVCKMRYDRDDDMMITGKRHDFRIGYQVGFDDAGQITGIEFRHDVRCGWAQDLSLPVADRAMLHSDNAYWLPAVRITSHRLKTNTQSATAFRGFGGPQGMVGIERVMGHIAHHLGLDPLAVRKANYYAMPPDTSEGTDAAGAGASGGDICGTMKGRVTPYHMEVEDFVLPPIVAALEESSDYAARRAAVRDFNAGSAVLKRGIALTPVKFGISFTLTHLNQAGALVHIYSDGSIHLNHGGTEMGQGLFTKVAQVAAEVFQQPLEAVRITATDTAKVPNTSATAASSGADLNGMATKAACETLKARLVDFAAEYWQAQRDSIEFTPEGVRVGQERISFAELAALAYTGRVPLSATGYYATPKISWDRRAGRGRPFLYFAYGAAVTEVAIDTLTGEYRLLRTDILHDCGRSLNPALDIGQIEGAYVQGAGWLTTEELVWDDKGRLRTHAPSTYKIPACGDRPEVFNVALWDGANREDTIYRSKAVGEPPFMLGISAFMALSDAVAACGDGSIYPALDAPATPERVLRAVSLQQGNAW
ncbi:xanthine dehydrogenase molybdopterin binding subunit [Halovulum sp. GXIMD14793]